MTAKGLLHDGLTYWARRTPDKVAVSQAGEQHLTYAALARWSDGVAEYLQSRGVRPGDNVALAASNSLRWVASAFGILKAGATIVPFNDRLVGAELAYLADNSQARLVIADAQRGAIMAEAGIPTARIALENLDRFQDGPSPEWREFRVDSSDVAMIIFTSGSTSQPKGAMMSHGNYLAKFMEMRLLDHRLGPATRALMPFGLHSSPGLPWGILFTTILGGTLYFTERYTADTVLRLLAGERIDFFIGAPMIYDQVAALPGFADADLSALTFARIGGATPSDATLQTWRDKGIALRQLYGMTEVGGGSIVASEEEARDRPDSCGRGLAFSRFRIARDDGADAAPNEPGHVLLQGPGMMLGYWRKPEETAAALRDGWMHTGDIGVVDEAGYFRFVDRSKEMIKSGGFNVSPAELEAVIGRHPAVREVCVFAVPDPEYAESIFACVNAESGLSEAGLFEYCRGQMAGYKLPRFMSITEEPLPRLANEKVDRRSLKARHADAATTLTRLGSSAAAATLD